MLPSEQFVWTSGGPATVVVTVVVSVVGTVVVTVGVAIVVVTVVVSVAVTVVVDGGAAVVTITVALAETPPDEARTVARPGDLLSWAVTSPALVTSATLESVEVHSTGPMTCEVEPSVYVPIAVSCRLSPAVSVTSDGSILIAVRVACLVAGVVVVGGPATDVVTRAVVGVLSVIDPGLWGSVASAVAGIPRRTPSARISVTGWRYQGLLKVLVG